MGTLKPRSGVMDIPLYIGGKSVHKDHKHVIKLSSNENPLGASINALDAYKDKYSSLHLYPDDSSESLKSAISKVHNLNRNKIICGAGSDEILSLACRAYAGFGDEIIHTEHAFLMYGIYARSVGATPISVREKNLTADPEAIIDSVTDSTRIVFLANPNNPTGTVLEPEIVKSLRLRLREDILLVLDGAYSEYMNISDHDGGLNLAENFTNVLVTRTFSKIYGLAGLRVGWAFGDESIINALERIRSPFNISTPALAAASMAMLDREHVNKSKERNSYVKKLVLNKMRSLGLEIIGESGNFVLTRFSSEGEKTAIKVESFLASQGILVRNVENYALPNHLRITIGTEEDMKRVLLLLENFLKG